MTKILKTFLRQPDWIAAVIISFAIIWLHFFFLRHAGGFWRDEVNTINLSDRSPSEMSHDSFPILTPLLVRAWKLIGLGQNDLSLRLFGIAVGLSLPAALWLAAWKIRRSPPLLGLALLTLNTTVIIFGDSLRAYGIGSVTILLTAAAACLFLKNPTWRRAGILTALAILSVQALYQNAFFIAAICFGAWTVCAREKNWPAAVKIFAVAAISAASLLPYWSCVVSLPGSTAILRTGFDRLNLFINLENAAGFPLKQYVWVWGFLALAVVVWAVMSLRHQPQTKVVPAKNNSFVKLTALAVAAAAAGGFLWFAVQPNHRWYSFPLLALAIFFLDKQPDEAKKNNSPDALQNLPLFACVTLLTAVASFVTFLQFAGMVPEPWYFLPLMALAAVCFEMGLPHGRHARAAIFGFAAVTAVNAIQFTPPDLNWRFTNVDLIAQRLTRDAAPDDFIIIRPWYCGITFDHYFKGSTAWDTLPPLKSHSTHRYDLLREQMEKTNAIQPVLEKISATLQSGHRVWVIASRKITESDMQFPTNLPPPPLKYSGWADWPYNSMWTAQTAQFLNSHSRQFTLAYYTTNQIVNTTESLKLWMAEGWRD